MGAALSCSSAQSPRKRHRHWPRRIVLIRHGQSKGNVDETEYSRTPDQKVELTQKGWEQAQEAGKHLRAMLPDGNASRVFVYCSPHVRYQQTLEGVLKGANISRHQLAGDVEEPRLREQDFGNFQDPEQMKICKAERVRFGRFFYRFPQGESGADAYDRVSNWMESLFRHMGKHREIDERTTLVIVCHGLTGRLFLMRWFHWTVAQFEEVWNPPNCSLLVMERSDATAYGYRLTPETRQALQVEHDGHPPPRLAYEWSKPQTV